MKVITHQRSPCAFVIITSTKGDGQATPCSFESRYWCSICLIFPIIESFTVKITEIKLIDTLFSQLQINNNNNKIVYKTTFSSCKYVVGQEQFHYGKHRQ